MTKNHTKVSNKPKLRLKEVKISTVHQCEYLLMILDEKLTMDEYLDVIWKKTNAKIGILSNIQCYISETTATRIYKSMTRPHLDYIDFVIDSASADRKRELDNFQKKAVRRIEYSLAPENRKHIETLLNKYNIEELKTRRKKNLVKIMHIQSTLNRNQVRTQTDMTMKLRSAKKVKMKNEFTNKTKVYQSLFCRGLTLSDSLPADPQKEKDEYIFRKKLFTYKL